MNTYKVKFEISRTGNRTIRIYNYKKRTGKLVAYVEEYKGNVYVTAYRDSKRFSPIMTMIEVIRSKVAQYKKPFTVKLYFANDGPYFVNEITDKKQLKEAWKL